MLNLFFIVLIGVFTIRKKVREVPKSDSHIIDDIKTVAKATVKYVLWAVFLLALFNNVIAKQTVDLREAEIRASIVEQYDDEALYNEMIEANPTLAEIDKAEAKAKALDGFEMYTKWYVQITLALIGLMAAAVIYSILISILWRNLMS